MVREEQTSNSLTLSEKKKHYNLFRKEDWMNILEAFIFVEPSYNNPRAWLTWKLSSLKKRAFAKSDLCLEFCCQPNNIALLTFQWVFVHTFRWEIIMQIAALTKLSTSQRSAQFPICGKTEIFMQFFLWRIRDVVETLSLALPSAVIQWRRHNAGNIWWKFWLQSLFCGVCET